MNSTGEGAATARQASVPTSRRTAAFTRADWLVPLALIMLSAVPFIAGVIRLVGLAGGAEVTPENARFFAAPLPVVLHILSATPFCILGAFQFAPGFRRRRPGWHRIAGRLLVVCGLVAGLSGLWMTLFYPLYPHLQRELLYGFRLLFGSGMVLSVALGLRAILRRDIARHRAWMMRGYALGQGAGTQALVFLLWIVSLRHAERADRRAADGCRLGRSISPWPSGSSVAGARTVARSGERAAGARRRHGRRPPDRSDDRSPVSSACAAFR